MSLLIIWIVMGIGTLVLGVLADTFWPESKLSPGSLGDMFGGANSLFSAFALLGVVVALQYQVREYRLAREHRADDLKQQEAIALAQREAASSQLLAARTAALSPWSALLDPVMSQRIMNLASLHEVIPWSLDQNDLDRSKGFLYTFLAENKPPLSEFGPAIEYLTPFYKDHGTHLHVRNIRHDLVECSDAVLNIRPAMTFGLIPIDLLAKELPVSVCFLLVSFQRMNNWTAKERHLRSIALELQRHRLEAIDQTAAPEQFKLARAESQFLNNLYLPYVDSYWRDNKQPSQQLIDRLIKQRDDIEEQRDYVADLPRLRALGDA